MGNSTHLIGLKLRTGVSSWNAMMPPSTASPASTPTLLLLEMRMGLSKCKLYSLWMHSFWPLMAHWLKLWNGGMRTCLKCCGEKWKSNRCVIAQVGPEKLRFNQCDDFQTIWRVCLQLLQGGCHVMLRNICCDWKRDVHISLHCTAFSVGGW